MEQIKIYGSSDDLVIIKGDVPGCDEHYAFNRPLFVELGCGDVFKAEYTDRGTWVITHHQINPTTSVVKTPHGEGDDPEPYTETVTITANKIGWVEVWDTFPPTIDEIRGKLSRLLIRNNDTFDIGYILRDDEVQAIWRIVSEAARRRLR